ncbi:MAG: ABC transporter permease [Anaerolineae bacterium]
MARTLQYLLTVALVLSLNFVLPRMMPGNPLADLDNPQGSPLPLSAEQRARVTAYYGLDRPLPLQFRDYWAGLLRGDLGWSLNYNAPVTQVLWGRLQWTLLLAGSATILYVTLGLILGSISAWHRGRALDATLLLSISAAGSFPGYFLAMLLLILFAVKLRFLPLGQAQSAAALEMGGWTRVLDIARHLVLPSLTLVLTNLVDIYYLTRNSLTQVLGEGYITVARARGLGEMPLLFRHALPNALLPVASMATMRLGFVVMGAVMIEMVFAYPGMGLAILEASRARDYPLLQGAFLVTMLGIMTANLLADGLYGLLDPRLREAR